MNTFKKFLIFSIVFLSSFQFYTHVSLAAEKINSYNTNIEILQDGSIDVIETIKYDFGNASRHGIFRDIPYVKENESGKKYKLDIKVRSVTDSAGAKYNFVTSREGENYNIKIGDADKYVTGEKTYIIDYKVKGALTYFSDHDELYWNILGNNWEVPVTKFSGKITYPNNIPVDVANRDITSICYTGSVGSTSQECKLQYVFNETGSKVLEITSTKSFLPGEGITIASSFPKGYVAVAEPEEYHLIHPIVLAILIIVAVLYYLFFPVFLLFNYFKERNRVKNNAKIVAAWFDPPKDSRGVLYTPAETSLLLKPQIDSKLISATIIQLAQRGYLKIHFTKKDGLFSKDKISFEQLKPIESTELKDFENDLLNALFSSKSTLGTLSNFIPALGNFLGTNDTEEEKDGNKVVDLDSLKRNSVFMEHINSFKDDLGIKLKMHNDTERTLKEFENRIGILSFISIMGANIPAFLITVLLLRKQINFTDKGIEQYSFAKSLKNFIDSQDAQYDFQAERQMFFEKLLPYATAFGVEDVWIKRFGDLDLSQSDWYSGNSTNFTDLMVMNSLLNTTISTAMTPTSSSSGFSSGFSGGSSGGGGGGGGGGSW